MNRHYTILGLTLTPELADLKSAYHRLAKRNHPDLFPDSERHRQQLKMMRINEAYMSVMSDIVECRESNRSSRDDAAPQTVRPGSSPRKGPAPPTGDSAGQTGGNSGATARVSTPEEQFFAKWDVRARRGSDSSSRALGAPRDPAYTYYKAGFRYYRLGATELFRKESSEMMRALITTGTTETYILRLALRALHYFERSYSYFFVVVDRYGESPWSHDARWKLRKLEKFSTIYQRICENLSRRSSTSRSSFSMVNGADPS